MWFEIRVSIILVVILVVCPSLQWRLQKRQVQLGGDNCKTPKGATGECIDLKTCPDLLEMLQEQKEPGWREYLLNSRCGSRTDGVVKVCCPDPLPDTSVCGRSTVFVNRVVNGQPAVLGAWPWMAALGYADRYEPEVTKWLCGGSLISNRHVLTAAHCLTNIGDWKLTVVRLGDLNLNDSAVDRATPINYTVGETIVHEGYNHVAHTVDIGIVKLKEKVEFTNLIRPICIPKKGIFKEDLTTYEPFVTGWGAIEFRGPKTPALQEAQVAITDQGTCNDVYKNSRGIDNGIICALSAVGKDACQGDSGGPLALPKNTNFYVIGVVSSGHKCAEPGYPGIYTKVSLYFDWIRMKMRS